MSAGPGLVEVGLDVSAISDKPAGAGRYVVELARALAKGGECGLSLIARRDDAARWAEIAPASRVLAVVPTRRPTRLFYEQARLASVVADIGPPSIEVYHGPHYTMPRRSKRPCVVTIHDMTFFDHPEWHERSKVAFFRAATSYSVRHAAAIVCVSEATAGRLRALLSPRCPVAVIAHGVDHARFVPNEPEPGADRELLRSLGLERPFVLHLGTIEPRKGIGDLVAAFDVLAPDHPDLELVLAGGVGWKPAETLHAIKTARAAGRVRQLGYVPEAIVPSLLRQARAVAYPSLEEGFGLPALEALACGTPLVTTLGTAMAELALEAALLVRPAQPRELAEAIESAIVSASGAEGRARRELGLEVAARYSWEACASGHLGLYREVARS